MTSRSAESYSTGAARKRKFFSHAMLNIWIKRANLQSWHWGLVPVPSPRAKKATVNTSKQCQANTGVHSAETDLQRYTKKSGNVDRITPSSGVEVGIAKTDFQLYTQNGENIDRITTLYDVKVYIVKTNLQLYITKQ